MKLWPQMTRDEREEAVLKLPGRTASQIGELLGTSRDAIISFVRRYSVPHEWGGYSASRKDPLAPSAEREAQRAARKAKSEESKRVALELLADIEAAKDEARAKAASLAVFARRGAWEALPGTTPALLHDLAPRGCVWPLWQHSNEPKLYCNGGAADREASYCPTHQKLAYPTGRTK